MKSVMVVLAMVFVVGCSAEETPLDDQVESNTEAVESPPEPPQEDLGKLLQILRQQCYRGCDDTQGDCERGACIQYRECSQSNADGTINWHYAECGSQGHRCNTDCSGMFGGGLG